MHLLCEGSTGQQQRPQSLACTAVATVHPVQALGCFHPILALATLALPIFITSHIIEIIRGQWLVYTILLRTI